MLFSSQVFLFAFLPLVLAVHWAAPRAARNAWLLAASLLFYAWEEPVVVLVMLASTAMNYAFGLWVERARGTARSRVVLWLAIAANLSLLVAFKYADWLWRGLSSLLLLAGVLDERLPLLGSHLAADSWVRDAFLNPDDTIRLPIGISFFTFQALSYVVDVHRRDAPVQRNPLHVALYIALFPQLIAGPIVRYLDVAGQLVARVASLERCASGARRFVLGLAKKVLVADVCAASADRVFALPSGELTTELAWLGIAAYTLQIYFDFSGYSDMAIGLGRMLGFEFLENFRHPYVACSITEFWRRWHISLSSWFRDYLYIPLGGNRGSRARTYANLLAVFLLCGLWHGASLTFVAWGAYHGLFLVLERVGLAGWLERRFRPLRHVYTLSVVMVGWVFFRADTFHQAVVFLMALVGLQDGSQLVDLGTTIVTADALHPVGLFADARTWIALCAGALGCAPWLPAVAAWTARLWSAGRTRAAAALEVAGLAALALLFVLCAMELAAGSYSPFIYFRF
ncbi:MAG: MBOAT family protein [Planctomycetes bacterium]|nr:MBOAT family protein [Planctomycetota bacterium]